MSKKYLKITNTSNNTIVAEKVQVADSFWQRFCGLMLRKSLDENEGLLIKPCKSIHMLFMRFSIDAVFLDANNKITGLYRQLRPWIGLSSWHSDASCVLELCSGTIDSTKMQLNNELKMEQTA